MRRILVTGAATQTGVRLLRRLESTPDVEVFAADDTRPGIEIDSELTVVGTQMDWVSHLLRVRPDTVVYLPALDRDRTRGGNRDPLPGAQAIIGATARSDTTKHLIVGSKAAIYEASPRSPSVHYDDAAKAAARSRLQRLLADIEGMARETDEARPDLTVAVLRLVPIIGPEPDTAISRYLRLAVVPTLLGFDPRLQFINDGEAARCFEHAALHPVPGTFNVAAPGQLYLSRILRLGRRVQQPLPKRVFRAAVRGLRKAGLHLAPDDLALLQHGRVLDTTSMSELGFVPELDHRETVLAAYGRADEGGESPEGSNDG